MNAISIIAKKRDKKELKPEEIDYFIKEYTKGNITDYQAAALVMAIYINGMTNKEITNLTISMANSGDTIDLSDISENIVDKHSTGGVGDKITLILMPIIASLGVPVAKMSGRGLGFTGGTSDKLESIPGYNVNLSIEDFKNNVQEIGISLITSSLNLAPADKKIYALRDTIGCTANIPLIASSIMSKKIASGANKILIDITCGNGAFMKDIKQAKELANMMIKIGILAHREVRCVITNMNEPTGYAIGNNLEVIEAIKALKGDMPEDIKEIIIALGTQMLFMAGKTTDSNKAKKMIEDAIQSRAAYEKFKELVAKQGGDVSYLEDTDKFQKAKHIIPIYAEERGALRAIDTEMIGNISVYLGAGRMKKEDEIDHAAGIVMNQRIGNVVEVGDIFAYIHTNDESKIEGACRNIKEAFVLDPRKVEKAKTIIALVK
ncbi:MAG: thymidine phosphorylase [Clostridia bacterium]|jgi:pyrimidine-nucleoside phosphorylase|nr:thymidine phosphorylase [Clostridia bacterium]